MKILSWNVRGLGKLRTIRHVKSKLRQVQPQLLFLIETKASARHMEQKRRKCGFMHGIDVDVIGLRGVILKELVAKFKREQVVEVIRAMAPLKASGKDGFPTFFYQNFCHVVEDEVEKFCLEVLNGQRDVERINSTNIVLILKFVLLKNMDQFRPISLFCKVFNGCVDETQEVFLSRRQITGNIFVAYEILHSFKKKKGKAYDKVGWNFFERVMGSLGLRETWISLVMGCVSSVS
ncbi:hypothetical protein V6Z11_A06G130400 [Gossypium hirsutum]